MQIFAYNSDAFATHINYLSNVCSNYSPLYSPNNNLYYSAYYEKEWENLSFSVCLGGMPLAAFLIAYEQSSGFSYFSLPCSLLVNPNVDKATQERAIATVIKQLKKKNILNHAFCYQEYPSPYVSSFSTALLESGLRGSFGLCQRLALSSSKEDLWQQMRKVYRKNISWGEEHIKLKIIDKDNYLNEHIESFRKLHIHVSGKETRSKLSWQRQGEIVKNGEAFIIEGYLDNTLISASLFIYNQHSCYYGVGAYQRELFDFPISHYPVWHAICWAQKLGCHYFDFGEMLFSNTVHLGLQPPSDKELSISHFKKGFAGLCVPVLQIKGN